MYTCFLDRNCVLFVESSKPLAILGQNPDHEKVALKSQMVRIREWSCNPSSTKFITNFASSGHQKVLCGDTDCIRKNNDMDGLSEEKT